MTFKKQIEESNAKHVAEKNAEEAQRTAKKAELQGIADKLEAHLLENEPDDVGLKFQREGARMRLKASDYTIVIDAGFNQYSGMVLVGDSPPRIAKGSQRKLNTLADVDAYITGILQANPRV